MFLFFCSLFDGMDPVASSFPRLPPAWLGSFSSPPHGTEQPMHVRPFETKKKSKPANFCGFFTGCPSSDFKLFPTAGCQLHSGLPYRRPSPDVTCGHTLHCSMPPWIRFDRSSTFMVCSQLAQVAAQFLRSMNMGHVYITLYKLRK